MRIRKLFILRCASGQALAETALILPLMLMIILNVINFGYFFLVALNLAAAPRSGAAYSIMGFSSGGGGTGLPAAGPPTNSATVSSLTYEDMHGALGSYASAKVQACSKLLGFNGAGALQKARCVTCTNATSACGATNNGSPVPDADPEAPNFVLHRVDVTYTFNTLIPGTPFNIALMPVSICTLGGSCTFHRQVSMRALD